MSQDSVNYLIDSVCEKVTVLLMSDKTIDMPKAMSVIYASQWFEKLSDPQTGLYYQSPNYNYELLKHELLFGKLV